MPKPKDKAIVVRVTTALKEKVIREAKARDVTESDLLRSVVSEQPWAQPRVRAPKVRATIAADIPPESEGQSDS